MRRSRHEQWARANGLADGVERVRHGPWECLCPEGDALDASSGTADQHHLMAGIRDPHEPMNPWPQAEVARKTNFGFVVRCGGCGMTRP